MPPRRTIGCVSSVYRWIEVHMSVPLGTLALVAEALTRTHLRRFARCRTWRAFGNDHTYADRKAAAPNTSSHALPQRGVHDHR